MKKDSKRSYQDLEQEIFRLEKEIEGYKSIENKDALKNEIEKAKSIINSIPSGIFIYKFVDPDRLILEFANKQAEIFTGLNSKEWIGKEFNEIWTTSKENGIIDRYLSVIKTGLNINYEDVYYKDDNVNGTFRYSIFNIPDDRLGVFFENITISKKTESSLKESHEQFMAFMENIPSMVIIKDFELRPLFFNNQFKEAFPAQDWLGKKPRELFSDEVADAMEKADMKALMEGYTIYEEKWTDKNGNSHYLETRKFAIKQDDLQPNLGVIITDISDRKNAENELLESEEKLRFLFENMTQGVIYHNADGKIVYANDSATRILGLTGEQFYGKTSLDPNWKCIHEDYSDYPGETHPVMVTIKTGKAVRNAVMGVFNPKKSTYNWININSIPKFNEDGVSISLIFVTIEDITNLKQTEMTLRESERKFRTLFASMTEMVALHDLIIDENGNPVNYRITDCNDAYTKITGITKESAIGKLATEAYGTENPPYLFEYCMVGITGNPFYFETYFEPMDKHFAISVVSPGKNKFATVTTDVTAIKKANKAVQEQNHFINSLLSAIPVAVFYKDKVGRYLGCNKVFTEIVGLTEEEILGKKVNELWPQELSAMYHQKDSELLHNLEHQLYESKVVDKNGQIRPVIYAKDIFYDAEGNVAGIVGAFLDITERKNTEMELLMKNQEYEALNEELTQSNERLFEAKEKAEESDLLKTAFLQNISHEIRTPMNAIIGFSNFLSNPDYTEEKRNSFVKIITDSSYQLLSIVNNVLTISALETNQEKVNFEKVNVNSVIIELISIFKNQSENQNLSLFSKQPLTDKQSEIYTDDTKLTQVLSNLMANALKFTHQGFVEIGYSIVGQEGALSVQFYVKDTGIGISHEKQSIIFNRFVQADSSIQSNYGGTGLGLSICKGFVELIGGKIWVESEPEKGATFFFTIPYNPVFKDETAESVVAKLTQVSTILVAEDDDYNFLYLGELLKDYKICIIHAINGLEAIDLVKMNPQIDLILMDIKMPKMDGYTAAKHIKEIRADLPIIAQSAYALEHEIEMYKHVFDSYLTKPIDVDKLYEVLSKYINQI